MNTHFSWLPFLDQPHADSCWSVSTGPDRRVYAAACCESLPGGTVELVRYDDASGRLETLFNVADVVEDPGDSGRGTQCKIHYSFAPSQKDGVLYMATHLSGPPIDQLVYSPWHSWSNPERCFRGAALVAFDTKTDNVLWWDTIIPKEGSRCLAIDESRGLLYSLSYPRDHLWVYDIEKRKGRDLGRIGSINAQVLMVDRKGRVWTSTDYGRIARYDPADGRIRVSPYVLPHNQQFQTGWHSVIYDAVASPEGDCVYGVTWIAHPRMFRLWWEEGEWGRIEDLGAMTQDVVTSHPTDTFIDHCGGLVFGPDGMLYGVSSRYRSERVRDALATVDAVTAKGLLEGILWRVNPSTLERENILQFDRPDGPSNYISRGAMNQDGDLFFGLVNHRHKPNGIFRVELPEDRRAVQKNIPLRIWG